MKTKIVIAAFAAFALSPALYCGCSSSDKEGRLTVSVSDAPVDSAKNVFITFTGVEIKPAGGDSFSIDYPAPRQLDLLTLTQGASEPLLDGVSLDAGQYNWIRLKVFTSETDPTACRIVLDDDSSHNLTIPSGDESGLKLNRPFAVPAGGEANFILDFDLRKSVHEDGGGYKLRPTVRIEDLNEVGEVLGKISGIGANVCESGAVYVFSGAGVSADDVDAIAPDPIASAAAFVDPLSGECRYKVPFLAAGDYTVAFTWDAAADNPLTDDAAVLFPASGNATIEAKGSTTLDLALP